ncbi:methyl-accepting chemotaxis protein 4 [Mariprofundus micogutta]|uniref:Methyl-accepting chemotaxis protein 4 n=1 Tax=Mariprofundus micogutta TaxID=1921010 RepID=A0A1L8CLY0_9PROT|nr:methyl-accepting chemotaxis protein [Mariprofundus micogutta]GAV19911.1 methyl-accepting chemotaxis protein 4 [Mariprofundus micogutta]
MEDTGDNKSGKHTSLKQMAGRNFIYSILLFVILVAIIFIAMQREQSSMKNLEKVYVDQFHIEQFRASLSDVVRPLNDFALTASEENFPKLKKAVKAYKDSYAQIKAIDHLTEEHQKALDQVNRLMSEVMDIASDVADKKIPANQADHVTVLAQNLVLATAEKLESIVISLEKVLQEKSAEHDKKAKLQLYAVLGFILLIVILLELFNRRLVRHAQELSKVSSSVAVSAGNMLSVSEGQVDAADQQSKFIHRVIKGLELISDSGHKISATVATMEKNADGTSSFVKGAVAEIKGLDSSIGKVRDVINTSSDKMSIIDQKSNQVLAAIGQILEVAEEANLLALNASIESTGDNSSVTSEVQAMSDQIRQVAEDIRTSVEELKTMAVESAGENSDAAQEIVQSLETCARVSGLMDKTQNVADKTTQTASVIMQASERQNDRNQKILQALKHISELLNISGTKLQESREATKRLSEASESLQNMS